MPRYPNWVVIDAIWTDSKSQSEREILGKNLIREDANEIPEPIWVSIRHDTPCQSCNTIDKADKSL